VNVKALPKAEAVANHLQKASDSEIATAGRRKS
jgi:hypothetical protein